LFIAVAALMILVPASAQALTLGGLVASPPGPPDGSTAGGAHSDFHLHMDFNGGQVKDLTVGLPPGMVGDPNATQQCTVAQLNSATAGNDGCPPNTQVGNVSVNATITIVVLPVTLNVTGKLYNVTPKPGEPARFGIVLQPGNLLGNLTLPLPPVILQSGVQLRPDFGLNTIINDIPNSTSGLPTTINSQDITLFGKAPATGKSFMRNPTSCPGPHTTNFTAVPYSGSTATGSANFSTTNCGALDFSPAFTAEVGGPGQTTNGVGTTASTAILQDTDEAGLHDAVVTVPPDLNPNATIFFGAHCSQADFLGSACPSNTVVGFATAASPLLSQPLIGNVVLVDPPAGAFPNLGLDLQGQLHLLLQGSTAINPNTVTFNGLPDIPISRFQLTFTNPPALLGTSRDLCTPPPPLFHAGFTGYNGASTSVDSPATVDGCGPSGNVGTKCKKHKAKKKHKKRAAESKKKHKKKRSCKKKKKHKKHHH
jgi:hypothetical protein